MENELRFILEKMDVPSMRRDVLSVANLGWLRRNLAIRNGNHPDMAKAMNIIKQLEKESRK
jgi:hypothetical protein